MRKSVLVISAVLSVQALAQPPATRPAQSVTPTNFDPKSATALRFRYIGPVGNRSAAVVGVPGDPSVYYAGAASGGIFKTTDGGLTWTPIFDDYGVSSIGSLAVARSDPNIVWAGTGEPHIRSHISVGNGIYKSTDAGRTWRRMGLEESGRISRILIHPTNPDIVYAGVQGHGYGPQQMRGLYRSKDGGQTWQRILFVDENTGVSDMDMDPSNPNKIIVGMWQLVIHTWGRESGGPGSGLHVTTDGGDTWTRLAGNGLPTHQVGKIAVRIAQSNPNRVYSLIETGDGVPWKGEESDNGELWRSEDGGNRWQVVSFDRNLACRQAYYTRLAISTDNPDEVYFMCATFSRSLDGGATSRGAGGGGGADRDDPVGNDEAETAAQQQGPGGPPFQSPGGDHHDQWIDPTNANRMINANDQNVAITTNRGRTWLRTNLPIGQMYHVTTDNRIPYYVYGNRQDGPSYRGPSNSRGGGGFGGGNTSGFGSVLPRSAWHGIEGGESGMATPDPVDTNIVWSTASGSGSRGGIVVRMDLRNRHSQQVEVWPLSTGGHPAANLKYRFIWNAPFIISPLDHNRVYTGSQYVHQSTDGGRTWREISPDLTRNDKSKQQFSGGLTGDNIGVEYGGTLLSINESRIRRGVMWTGSNDGVVSVTRDTARTWTNVSSGLNLSGAAAWGSIKSVEPSHWDPAAAYITLDAHQEGDFGVYVFRTKDYGKTWTKITNGVNPAVPGWANMILEDPVRRGLLYLGTENALYISYNDGDNWVRFNNNLPPAPVYGLTVQEHFNDLAVATYGRGFYILDDITPFQQLTPAVLDAAAHLFPPRAAYRFHNIPTNYDVGNDASAGFNPVYGAAINYWVKSAPSSPARIDILDSTRKVVRTMTQTAAAGINRIHWNFEGDTSRSARLFTKPDYNPEFEMNANGSRPGFGSMTVTLAPGRYSVRLTVNGVTETQPLEVRKDPNGRVSLAEINAQFRALLAIQRDYNQAAVMTEQIEKVRQQIQAMRGSAAADVRAAGDALESKFKEVEGRIIDLRITGRGQDGVRWPVRLAGQLQYVASTISAGEYAPTASQREVAAALAKETRDVSAALTALCNKDLADHNGMLRGKGLKTIDGCPGVVP